MRKKYLNPRYAWRQARRAAKEVKATAMDMWSELLRLLQKFLPSPPMGRQQSGSTEETTSEETPEPQDQDGRYAVLDGQDQQQGLYDSPDEAIEAWKKLDEGRVIDTLTGADITPNLGFLTEEQLGKVMCEVRGTSVANTVLFTVLSTPLFGHFHPIREDLLRSAIQQINTMRLPIFDVTNIDGRGKPIPTKTVPIKRRKVEMRTERRIIEVESKGMPSTNGRIRVLEPTDDMDIIPIRGVRDVTRVSGRQLAVPSPILEQRIVRRQLVRPEFYEETPGDVPVRMRKVWEEFQRPVIQEWTDQIEVADVPQAQLLEILIDVSPSMAYHGGEGFHLAVALATVVVSKHLKDGSRYIVRPFTRRVGRPHIASTEAEKRQLVRFLRNGLNKESIHIGSGTQVMRAVETAATDVRAAARTDDRPQILLITDADDAIYAQLMEATLRKDVILHTVVVGSGGGSISLRRCSHTYSELRFNTATRQVRRYDY